MIGSGIEGDHRLALIAKMLMTFDGVEGDGGEDAKRKAGEMNGRCSGMGFKMGDETEGAFICACGVLYVS